MMRKALPTAATSLNDSAFKGSINCVADMINASSEMSLADIDRDTPVIPCLGSQLCSC